MDDTSSGCALRGRPCPSSGTEARELGGVTCSTGYQDRCVCPASVHRPGMGGSWLGWRDGRDHRSGQAFRQQAVIESEPYTQLSALGVSRRQLGH